MDARGFGHRSALAVGVHIVGAEVNQCGVKLATGKSQVANAGRIDGEGLLRPVFDLVHPVVRGRVDNDVWLMEL